MWSNTRLKQTWQLQHVNKFFVRNCCSKECRKRQRPKRIGSNISKKGILSVLLAVLHQSRAHLKQFVYIAPETSETYTKIQMFIVCLLSDWKNNTYENKNKKHSFDGSLSTMHLECKTKQYLAIYNLFRSYQRFCVSDGWIYFLTKLSDIWSQDVTWHLWKYKIKTRS